MIVTLAWRTLTAHPIRSVVLSCGFGVGVSVMATLLGVGEVVLQQAKAPALVGGGDLVVSSITGPVTSARFVQSSILTAPAFRGRVKAASPIARSVLYLKRGERTIAVYARGGVPSLERVLDDPETAKVASWIDAPADRAWTHPDPGDVLRAMDRFHPVPDVPARLDSWAEWLYFNGHARETRFYLTFLVGPPQSGGRRVAIVRLQLDRAGKYTSYSEDASVDEATILANAPDLVIGRSRVRLEAARYLISLDLTRDRSADDLFARAGGGKRLTGELAIAPVSGRALPPGAIRGGGGWVTGYTAPAMSAALSGTLKIGGAQISLDGGTAYHDHNWGFWRGVSWRWGQVQHEGLSFIYGRIFPPADTAEETRIPGFLAALGADGPLAYATRVTIDETSDTNTNRPRRIVVRGRGRALDLTLDLTIDHVVATPMSDQLFGGGMDFLQLRAQYHVSGQAAGRAIDFTAPGSAETFRVREGRR